MRNVLLLMPLTLCIHLSNARNPVDKLNVTAGELLQFQVRIYFEGQH